MKPCNPALLKVWKQRLRFRIESSRLRTEIYRFCTEIYRFWTDSNRFLTEGERLWSEAILTIYGNIALEWHNWSEEYYSYECWLENGEVYGFPQDLSLGAKGRDLKPKVSRKNNLRYLRLIRK